MFLRVILLSLCLGVSLAAIADDNADAEIYIENNTGPWGDWSWATRSLRSSTYAHSHQYSCRVQFSAWTAIRFHHESGGLDLNGFENLEFWVHGGSNSGQRFAVFLNVNGSDRPSKAVTDYVAITAGQWKKVVIPLADLGAATGVLHDVYFREASGNSVSAFWFDDLKLTKPLPIGQAVITVDRFSVIKPVTKLMIGVNTAAWDWSLADASTRRLLKEGGFSFLRFPGGSTSDEYSWANNSNRRTGTVYGSNTDAFLKVANTLGAEKSITINYGSGTAAEARSWLVYTNINKRSNVLYWSVGNENFGTWEYDTHTYKNDATTYAGFVADCFAQMKSVDSRIKIGIAGTWSETDWPQRISVTNPRTGSVVNGWSAVLLKSLADRGVVPDYYELHYYTPTGTNRESDACLLQAADDWETILPAARQLLTDYLGAAGVSAPIYVFENNASANGPFGRQMTSLVNALYAADSCMQSLVRGASAFMWWDLHNGAESNGNNSASLFGWRNIGDLGMLSTGNLYPGAGDPYNTPYPTYYAFKILSRFMKPGDRLVNAVSSNELLGVYAAVGTRGSLKLLVLNKARGIDIPAVINAPGLRGMVGTRYFYGISQDAAKQDIQTSSFTGASSFSHTFPRYSLTVFDFGVPAAAVP